MNLTSTEITQGPDLDRQLQLLADHRQEVTEHAAVAFRRPRRDSGRLPLLAVAAIVVGFLGTGAYLAARSTSDGSGIAVVVDAADLGRPLTDAGPGEPEATATTPRPDAPPPGQDEPAPSSGDGVSTTAPPPSTLGDDEPTETVPAEIGVATAWLADATTAVGELTADVATSSAASARQDGGLDRDPEREQATSDAAVSVVEGRAECASADVDLATFSIELSLAGCPAPDGRPITGTMTAAVQSWDPLEVVVFVDELTIGVDRYWLGGTLTFPRVGGTGAVEPVLTGEVTAESSGAVFNLNGSVRFLPNRMVVDAEMSYVTDTEVTEARTVPFRPGQTLVVSDLDEVVVATGSCAPSSGTAAINKLTVIGTKDGSSVTYDPEQIDYSVDASATITYLSTTPTDGIVDLQLADAMFRHRLLAPCTP